MTNRYTTARALTPARRVLQPLENFLRIEAASGIVLLIAAAAALIWANSPWAHTYEAVWHAPLTLGVGSWVSQQSLHFWINDGLMTIFFLVVGLEIRNELYQGALSNPRQAALPAFAALGGVVVPAAIYYAINFQDPTLSHGWAVPTATDIAFAVGVLALLGKRAPAELRVLLLALAIIDDIAAIVVIALFYSSGVTIAGLVIAAVGMIVTVLFQRLGIRSAWIYVLPGLIVWIGMVMAGVHPAIAGVILGLLTPVKDPRSEAEAPARAIAALDEFRTRRHRGEKSAHQLDEPLRALKDAQIDLLPPVLRVQSALHPWVAYVIMPLFALANAGISFTGLDVGDAAFKSVAFGVGIGLLLGKPLGICLATFIVTRLGLCELPRGIGAGAILVLGCLGGIGFTMAIFISNLAFHDAATLAASKFGILLASTAAALVALVLARVFFAGQRTAPASRAEEASAQ